MGSVVSSKVKEDGKICFEVVLDTNESLQLKGQVENVHIFSEKNMEAKSRLTKRGKNDATMYFLVPKEFREGLLDSANAKCQIIQSTNKRIFIFSVDDFR